MHRALAHGPRCAHLSALGARARGREPEPAERPPRANPTRQHVARVEHPVANLRRNRTLLFHWMHHMVRRRTSQKVRFEARSVTTAGFQRTTKDTSKAQIKNGLCRSESLSPGGAQGFVFPAPDLRSGSRWKRQTLRPRTFSTDAEAAATQGVFFFDARQF